MKYIYLSFLSLCLVILSGCSDIYNSKNDSMVFYQRPLIIPPVESKYEDSFYQNLNYGDYSSDLAFKIVFNKDIKDNNVSLKSDDINFLTKAGYNNADKNIKNKIDKKFLTVTSEDNKTIGAIINLKQKKSSQDKFVKLN